MSDPTQSKLPEESDTKTLKKEVEPKPSIFTKIGLNHPILNYRTPFDKTPRPCIDNIILGTAKSFGITFGAKFALGLLKVLLNFKKATKDPKFIFE